MSRRIWMTFSLAVILAIPAFGLPLDPPAVSVVSSDRTSITLGVQAGGSGAPDGFIVEWLPAVTYQALGSWPSSTSAAGGSTYDGVPTLHVTPGVPSFRLGSREVVRVVLGEVFDETGVTAADRDELDHGTDYVVRVRAAGGSGHEESASSVTVVCATRPRTSTDCTVSQGYWKRHPESWSRVASVTLGSVSYTRSQLLAIFGQPARGNGLVSLAHRLLAAKLNVLLGVVPPPEVDAAVREADALIGSNLVPPIGGGTLDHCQVRSLIHTLSDFNSGTLGPGHCPDSLHVLPAKSETWGGLKVHYR